jgi:hypothetical protein
MRFVMGKRSDDIREAISLGKQAVEAVDADGILMRVALVNVLSNLLGEKYKQDVEVADLDEAIDVLGRGSPINSS